MLLRGWWERCGLPKKGMQGGLAEWSLSRYSPKFLVLAISLRNSSRTVVVRELTCDHVRESRCMGAVPRAEMMEVRVEKLFIARHFWKSQSDRTGGGGSGSHTSATITKCLMTYTRFLTSD